jgi:hypothetical protein
MTRTHGRCLRGKRVTAKVPHGRWRTLTFLAALGHDGIAAPCVIDGPINGRAFLAYVEQVLVPTLKLGDIVVADALREALRSRVLSLAKACSMNPGERRVPIAPLLLPCRTTDLSWRDQWSVPLFSDGAHTRADNARDRAQEHAQ